MQLIACEEVLSNPSDGKCRQIKNKKPVIIISQSS